MCKNWQNGECKRGVSCHFQHDGFPVEQKRCFICKSSEHGSKECKCPGGGADPQKDKQWEEYRARKLKAGDNPFDKHPHGDTGKGQKGKGNGKSNGKSKGNRNGKDKGQKEKEANAKACVDPERAAAAGGSHGSFPRNCVALDSWANVWLKHQEICLKTITKMYFTLLMANAIATGRPP